MPVLTDIAQLAVCPAEGAQGDLGLIAKAALVWESGAVLWVGSAAALPAAYAEWPRESAGGRLVMPGLIDCHTHLAFGGWRADEFEQKLLGRSYLEIARQGGGIASTVKATRAASEDELHSRARSSLDAMLRLGVTTVECKSGYGLNVEDELKQLRVYRRLAEEGPQRIVPTCLGAHIVPPECKENRKSYLRLLTDELIPQVADESLARFFDVFVEDTAFSREEARTILHVAATHGLRAKLHADQLTDTGGGVLAAELDAASADHLECINANSIRAMAKAGIVAVSLPLATLYLNQEPLPARALIDAGVPVAVATDFNPGSAPSYDLHLALWLACTRQRMTPAEALKGATAYAARALLRDDIGSLEPGNKADFVVVDAPSVNHWLYHFHPETVVRTVISGETAWKRARIP
ncbi:MAG: imidazolonepropionase [Rhodothermaceae bacterium]|nr:imidazolonepropionase [Rhodothermaceae bacterium]